MTEEIVKDRRDVKRNLSVEQHDVGIFVYAIASTIDKGDGILKIPAKFGEPIGNECYDMIRDVYYVEGVDYLSVGNIPVNYKLVDRTSCWSSDIPLPKPVLRRHMSAEQKAKLADWKLQYPSSNYQIQFLQILNVY